MEPSTFLCFFLLFCGSFATSAALFESLSHNQKRQPALRLTVIFGCGGRTRTYDLRVMSPTSFQLLYSAIFRSHSLSASVLYHGYTGLSRGYFLSFCRTASSHYCLDIGSLCAKKHIIHDLFCYNKIFSSDIFSYE